MKPAPKLVLVCQVFHPDTMSTSQLLSPLFKELSADGWDVEVLSGYPALDASERLPKREVWNGVRIRRCGLRLPLKRNLFYRGLTYLTYLCESWVCLMRSDRAAHWFAVTNPPFASWILGFASWLRRRKFTYMFQDIQPEGLVALGDINGTKAYVRLWKMLNRWSYARAEKVVVLGRDMNSLLTSNYGIPENRISYLPHWSAAEVSEPIDFSDSSFTDKWQLRDKFVVQYSGNMGLWHDMHTFVQAAKKLESDEKIQFVFIGGGIRLQAARKLAEELQVANIQWRDFVPLEDLSQSLAACHVSLISLRDGLNGIAVPCKLYGILASGRAIIAQVPSETEVSLTVEENDCGCVVAPGDILGLASAILKLANDEAERTRMGQNAFSAYREKYQLESGVSRMQEILNTPAAELSHTGR